MMVDSGSGRWWWSGPGVGTMRRRGMVGGPPDRCTRVSTAGRRFARKVPRTSVAPARGRWHRRAEDRSCSGGAHSEHLGPAGVRSHPRTGARSSALAEDLAPDSWATSGPRSGHKRSNQSGQHRTPNGSASSQLTDQIWPSAPGRQRGVAAARSAAWPQHARCPRLHMSQPVNVTCWHQAA